MVSVFGSAILLCWIIYLLPFVHCQFDGVIVVRDGPFGNGDGHRPFGKGFGKHPFGGGRFRGGGGGGGGGGVGSDQNQSFQQGDQAQGGTAGNVQPQDVSGATDTPASDTAASSTIVVTVESSSLPAPAAAAAAAESNTPVAPPAIPISSLAIPTAATTSSAVIFQSFSSADLAFGGTSTLVAAIPALAPSSSDSLLVPSVSVDTIPITSASTTITMTEAITVMVTPSPIATASSTPTMDLAPLSTSTAMSFSARAGMGVGITFGLLSVASIAGFYLYRRHQNKHWPKAKGTSTGGGLGGFTILNVRKKGFRSSKRDDQEWEIASAEKVEIVSGASARTMSRSDSRSTAGLPSRDGATPPPATLAKGNVGGGSGEVIAANGRIGLDVFDKVAAMKAADGGRSERGNLKTANPALTSNPPRFSVFPSPPHSSKGSVGSVEKNVSPKGETKRTGSWPLPD